MLELPDTACGCPWRTRPVYLHTGSQYADHSEIIGVEHEQGCKHGSPPCG